MSARYRDSRVAIQTVFTRARAFALAAFGLALLGMPTHAEMGPCKPQKLENGEFLICGAGSGAAMVIPDTISPNRKFALAWHNADGEPTDESTEDNETLLVRLADGAVLAKAPTDYFNTGAMHANRIHESADWSPDSRMVVRRYNTRYDTEAAGFYAIAADGTLAVERDLLAVVQPAVGAAVKQRKHDPDGLSFSIDGGKHRLGNDGIYSTPASYFAPKGDATYDYRVTVKFDPIAREGDKTSGVRIVEIKMVKN